MWRFAQTGCSPTSKKRKHNVISRISQIVISIHLDSSQLCIQYNILQTVFLMLSYLVPTGQLYLKWGFTLKSKILFFQNLLKNTASKQCQNKGSRWSVRSSRDLDLLITFYITWSAVTTLILFSSINFRFPNSSHFPILILAKNQNHSRWHPFRHNQDLWIERQRQLHLRMHPSIIFSWKFTNVPVTAFNLLFKSYAEVERNAFGALIQIVSQFHEMRLRSEIIV